MISLSESIRTLFQTIHLQHCYNLRGYIEQKFIGFAGNFIDITRSSAIIERKFRALFGINAASIS